MILQGFSGFLFFTGYKMATSAEFFVAIIFCRYGIKLERLVWELEKSETELWQIPPDPILEKVAALLSEKIPEWSGTPTELTEALQLEVKPNLLTKHLLFFLAMAFNLKKLWMKRENGPLKDPSF